MSSSSQIPDFTGHLVDEGRLRLTEVLGSGNYGTVYKALDITTTPATPTHYAVKCLGPVIPNTTQGSRYDEREIKLHTLCNSHPNVATLYRRFSHQGFLFIVLELSAGGHLFDAIDTGVFRHNDALVRDVFLQLIDTVRSCHERGVYHRDLKPENILCNAAGGDIRIADFGLATDSAVPCAHGGGSASYMSPESLTLGSDTETYEPRQSDVWALCIVLLNLMSGLYLWRRAHDDDTGFDAFLTDAGYLRHIFPISDPLNDLLERCFRPVPHTRPTLLQLRTEIAEMERLFSSAETREEQEKPELLRPICLSAPASMSTGASFAFSTWLAPAPSTNATSSPASLIPTLTPSASFDSSALRPTRTLFVSETRFPPVFVVSHPHSNVIRASSPSTKGLLKRMLKWIKKATRGTKKSKKSKP